MGTMLGGAGRASFEAHAAMVVHQAYIEVGARMIKSDSFCASSAEEIHEAVVAAMAAADGHDVMVGASIGPTAISRENTKAAIHAGASLIVFETMLSTAGCKDAAGTVPRGMPFILSATLARDGLLLSGETVGDFISACEGLGASAIGINCGYGPESTIAALITIAETGICTYASPSAGLPDHDGQYDWSPKDFARAMTPIVKAAGNGLIIGGCCGTTPEHIAELVRRFG